MEKPQKKEGYTKIENDLYDAIIKWHFSSYEYRILIFIIRKTHGWSKKEDWISLSQFTKATNIKESHVCRTINLLVKQNVITKGGNRGNPLYSVQNKYKQWIKLPKGDRSHHKLLPKGDIEKGVIQNVKGGNSDVKRGEIQKKLYTKETKQNIKVETSSTPLKKKKVSKVEKYTDPTPMSLEDFVTSMGTSPQRRMQILGNYADEIKPHRTTKGQWVEFIQRNVVSASKLVTYDDDFIGRVIDLIRKDVKTEKNPKGYLTSWNLETVLKYVDRLKK